MSRPVHKHEQGYFQMAQYTIRTKPARWWKQRATKVRRKALKARLREQGE